MKNLFKKSKIMKLYENLKANIKTEAKGNSTTRNNTLHNIKGIKNNKNNSKHKKKKKYENIIDENIKYNKRIIKALSYLILGIITFIVFYMVLKANKFQNQRRLSLNNYNYYIGEIKEGKPNGKGKEYNKYDVIIYEGDFIDGLYDGIGLFYLEEKNEYYYGNFKKGKFNGKGILYQKLKEQIILNNDIPVNIEFYALRNEELMKIKFNNEYIINKEKEKEKYNYYDISLIYEGDFIDDESIGKGKLYDVEQNIVFEGNLINGIPNGYGKIYKEGILKYEGYFKNAGLNGKCNNYEKDRYLIGQYLIGNCDRNENINYSKYNTKSFRKEYINLKGKFYMDENFYLIGKFKDGFVVGKAKIYEKNNILRYEGEMKNNKLEGKGKYYYDNGDYYIGQFKNYKLNGIGKLFNKNGVLLYEGEFVDDKFDGKGRYNNLDYIYEGEFKNDMFLKGKVFNKEGKLFYEGNLKNGFEEGMGKKYLKNGGYYIGEFKNGLMDGQGKLYNSKNELLYEGNYVNGKREGKGKVYLKNGNYVIIECKNDFILAGNYPVFDKDDNFIENVEYNNDNFSYSG